MRSEYGRIISCACVVLSLIITLPAIADNHESGLGLVIAGTQKAATLIKGGCGKMTEHFWINNGALSQEKETRYDVSYSGGKYSVTRQVTYIKNDIKEADHTSEQGTPIPPGTKIDETLWSDGEKVTYYEPVKRRAIVDSTASKQLAGNIHHEVMDILNTPAKVMFAIDWTPRPNSIESSTERSFKIQGREAVNGSDCIVVERVFSVALSDGEQATRTFVYWVDPNKAFGVVKMQRWFQGGHYKQKTLVREEVTQMKDYGGLWAPCIWEASQFDLKADGGSEIVLQVTVTYDKDFQFKASAFNPNTSPSFPGGTDVFDKTHERTHSVP